MPNDTYNSPFNARYASKEMQYIYSPDFKFKTWREKEKRSRNRNW